MSTWTKDPDSRLEWGCDWSAWLTDGDTITASEWAADSDTITLDTDSHDDTTTVVWVTGGKPGTRVRLTNRITTTQGRTDDRTITLLIRQR